MFGKTSVTVLIVLSGLETETLHLNSLILFERQSAFVYQHFIIEVLKKAVFDQKIEELSKDFLADITEKLQLDMQQFSAQTTQPIPFLIL